MWEKPLPDLGRVLLWYAGGCSCDCTLHLLVNSIIKSCTKFSSSCVDQGFYDGVTGVVTKPIKGAQEDGVEGFFKGLGKGAVGFFVRPVTGIVDFTSGSLDAVKR